MIAITWIVAIVCMSFGTIALLDENYWLALMWWTLVFMTVIYSLPK